METVQELLAQVEALVAQAQACRETYGTDDSRCFPPIRAAIALLEHATTLAPHDPALWIQMGQLAFDELWWDKALVAFEQVCALQPSNARVWALRGATLARLDRDAEAWAALETAVACDPQLALTWKELGYAYWSRGRYEEALAAFTRARTLDESDVAAAWHVASMLAILRRNEEALTAYRRVLGLELERGLEPGAIYAAWMGIGQALRRLGRDAEAADAERHAKEAFTGTEP